MQINIGNVVLNYEKVGFGRPLIMLHGNGESLEIFNKAIDKLKNMFTIYTIDTRGHGKSSEVTEYHYEDMKNDLKEFINRLNIYKPIVYGFSDGGITGILLAIEEQDLISELIVSGVNINPKGIKSCWLAIFKIMYMFNKDPKFKMMLNEPNISIEELKKIKVKTKVTVGSRDVIDLNHTKLIANNIENCKLIILKGETHGSYIVNSDKIAKIIKNIDI